MIEALKVKDNDLYALLKSQWAHRFGVESLEELKSLDLNVLNQNPTNLNVDNQKMDQSQENSFEGDKEISIKDNDNQEEELKNKESELSINKNHQVFKIESYEIVDKENKALNSVDYRKSQPEIKALIPLPPKPKYSYLKKWLLRK